MKECSGLRENITQDSDIWIFDSCKDKNRILPQHLWDFFTTCRIVTSVGELSFLFIKRFLLSNQILSNFGGIYSFPSLVETKREIT